MSDIDGSDGIAAGTAGIIDHLTPGARPSSREYDGREPGDIEAARVGVDLLFASIVRRLCPEEALLAPDRGRLLWNAVEYLRSHVGRLEARLAGRLTPRQQEREEDRGPDARADDDAGDEEFLRADQAEGIQHQIDVLRGALYHALTRYGEVVERPWLVRHGSLDMQGSEQGLGAQIDAEAFLEARGAWQPAPDALTRVREAMEEQAEKRAKLRAAALGHEAPAPLAELELAGNDGGEDTAVALAGMFRALSLVYPDGTQLQDERAAGAWRLVRLFDATAEQTSAEAMNRMPDHPALQAGGDAGAVAAFDEETLSFVRRTELLARATDGAAALYLETTEEEWNRQDPAMTAAGGPRTPAHAGLTGEHYAATHRAAQLGHPSPLPLDGPHVVIAGGAELDPDTSRETVEAALERLHERIPGMVLHYAARLQDGGGKSRLQGVDPAVRRWAAARRIPLIPHPASWDAENGRYDIHGRDDGWIAMKPDLILDFGGGNAHRRFLALARERGIEFRSVRARSPSQAEETAIRSAAPDGSEPADAPEPANAEARWLGLATNAERLFQAGQDGWLHPRPGAGLLLGHESFVAEGRSAASGSIPVRLTFDPGLIPFDESWRDLEQGADTTREGADVRTVRWRAPLPMSAVTKIEVASREHKAELVAAAHRLSEFVLPAIEIEVSHAPVNPPTDRMPDAHQVPSLELPEQINAIQGAMAMAAWAAPDTEPWTGLLDLAFDGDAAAAAAGAADLGASWLEFPWLSRTDAAPPSDDEARLWRAAVACMLWDRDSDSAAPSELAARIADAASRDAPNPTAGAWLDRTFRLLAHEDRLSSGEALQNGPGLAIQLALLRPGPVPFSTWNTSLPDLPPAVRCAGAALCGWQRGYRLLPGTMRGTPEFQKSLPARALAASRSDAGPLQPSADAGSRPPDVRRDPAAAIDPDLHAFFMNSASASHNTHADLAFSYRDLWRDADGQLHLLAYLEAFEDFREDVRYARDNPDPEADAAYDEKLASLASTLRELDDRRARVSDFVIEVSRNHSHLEALTAEAAQDGQSLSDHPGFSVWRDAGRQTLDALEQLRASPDMRPHIDFVLAIDDDDTTSKLEAIAGSVPASPAETAAANTRDRTAPLPAQRHGDVPASAAARANANLARSETRSVESNQVEESPANTEPRIFRWAGIGSRQTPDPVLADMTALARRMADAGWHLSSGGARGADSAFAAGTPVERRTIWLPKPRHNGLTGPDCHVLTPEREQECMKIAGELHPWWHEKDEHVRKLHARNVAILLGPDLDRPVDAVVCWTEGGRLRGGTAMGIRIAREWGIPVLNLGSMTMEVAWEKLQQLQQGPVSRQQQERRPDPAQTRTRERTPAADDDKRRRRDLRRDRALSRVRGMLRDFDIAMLPRDALAELHDTREADRATDERLHALTPDQLESGLDRLQGQIDGLREEMPAGGAATPEGREAAMRIAAMEAAADRFHAVLADKTLADMREEHGPDTGTDAAEAQKRALAVMVSVWRLAREGPLATESNRLVSKAASLFAAQHRWVDDILAAETRERSGLGLAHAPGSPEETAALARGAADTPEAGDAYEYMRTDAETREKDDAYLALGVRARRLDLMARTASTFSEAVRIDMRREFKERDRLRTQHLDGAETPDAVRGREQELRAAHGQLIDDALGHLEAASPVDHVSGEDREKLLSRFAGVFRELARELTASVQRTVNKGKNAEGFRHRQAAANYMGELANHADRRLATKTNRQANVWTPSETQNAGEWLMERLRRARDRRRAESLAPEGRHLAIVGGRALGDEHAQRIAQELNHERARNPETPLVLHCIDREGAGLHAAKWAAMHGVPCVTHRPKRYSASQLRKRDALLLGVPPDTLWNFGADPDRDRAAHMLLDSARKAEHPIEIRDMDSEPDGLLVSEAVIDPPLAVDREFKRIYETWKEAAKDAGDGVLIYRPGIEELRPDIDRILATPHLTGNERSFLTNFKALLDSESRLRGEIDTAVVRGREQLAQYEALMEQRGPHVEGTVLFDTDPDYRKWELRATQIVRTFENWFGIDDAGHREHIDRRRLDLTDIAAELRAIRKTARSAELPPHRIEIPLIDGPGPVDQRLDPEHYAGLMGRALVPEDERDPAVVAELARWSRAWPKETLALFRLYVDDAVQAKQKVSTHRLASGLPPALAAGMSHISEEIWAREAVAIGERQQMRERGMGMSA